MTHDVRDPLAKQPVVAPAAAGAAPDALARIEHDLRSHVMGMWQRYYPVRASSAPPELRLQIRHFGYSVLFSAALIFAGEGSERFMIKLRRKQKDGSILPSEVGDRMKALARTEYIEHLKAYEFFSARRDGLAVVRPLDFIDRYHALVVDHALGTDLSQLVRDNGAIAMESVRRCGMWWRTFHRELHGAGQRCWDPAIVEQGLETRLARLRKIGARDDVTQPLARRAVVIARRLDPVPVPLSLIHGDCKLRHVWATDDGVQVLDFGNTKPGDSWVDPAAFVAELAMYSLWSNRLVTESHVPFMRALVEAYFEGVAPPTFWLSVADCMFKKWHRRLRKWGSNPGLARVRQSLQMVGLDKPVERLYIDRWFTTQIGDWLSLAEGKPPGWLTPLAG